MATVVDELVQQRRAGDGANDGVDEGTLVEADEVHGESERGQDWPRTPGDHRDGGNGDLRGLAMAMIGPPMGFLAPGWKARRRQYPGSRIGASPGLPACAQAVTTLGLTPQLQWRDRVGF